MHSGFKSLSPEVQQMWRSSVERYLQKKRWHAFEQWAILLLSGAAFALVDLGPTPQWRFWGNVVGLAAQPLWLLSTWRHRQWGMLGLTVFYIGIWTAGLYRHH